MADIIQINQTIETLDLEPIVVKIIDKEEGMGWDLEYARLVEAEYKKFGSI